MSARWIRSKQRDDGTWGNFWGAPADLSTTVESYAALKLAGDPVDAEHMRRAREYILDAGGLERTRVFTKIWFSLFGLWSWDDVPVMPPEMMLLPPSVPLNIYDFACWARQTVAALTVVSAFKPIRPVPVHARRAADGDAAGAVRAARVLAGRVPATGQAAARLRAAAVVRASARGAEEGRALHRRPAGGRRLVGRHPATVGLLADGAQPARLSGRAPAHPEGARGPRQVHDRRRRDAAPRGLPVTGLGYGARADRPRRRRARARPSGDRAGRTVAAGRGGTPPRRLGDPPAAIGARRLGLRVRERLVSGHRRHRRGGHGPQARLTARPGRGESPAASSGRSEWSRATAAGARSTPTTSRS